MTQGDICWVEFPAGAGRAQAGRRPAVILQGATEASVPTLLLVPLTTQLDALRFPGTVLVEPDLQNRLRRASAALVFQLTAVDKRFLSPPSGRVSSSLLEALVTALHELTPLPEP